MPKSLFEDMYPCTHACLLHDLHIKQEMENNGERRMTAAEKLILRNLEALSDNPNKQLEFAQMILTDMFEKNKLLNVA